MKNTLEGIHSRLHIAEENISELEDLAIETMQNEREIKDNNSNSLIY